MYQGEQDLISYTKRPNGNETFHINPQRLPVTALEEVMGHLTNPSNVDTTRMIWVTYQDRRNSFMPGKGLQELSTNPDLRDEYIQEITADRLEIAEIVVFRG